MEEQMKKILNSFDIRKLKARCNSPGCRKRPDFETLLFQRSPRKNRKNLASLYICEEHLAKVQDLADDMRANNPRMIIDFQKIDIRKGR